MKYKKTLVFLIALLFVFFIVVISIFNKLNNNYVIADNIIIEINRGDSDKNIFAQLKQHNLIRYSHIHIFAMKLLKIINDDIFFHAGEYLVTQGDNYFSVIDKMLNGVIYRRKITIAEGQTISEVVAALDDNEFFSGKIDDIPAEGSILPETYFFAKDTDRNKQLQIMQRDLETVLDDAWHSRDVNLPLKNKEELLILASIVEKETGLSGERDHIAGVFVNRLRLGMRLQSDPTVIYAITKGKYKLERPLSKRDLRRKSEYNTYHIFGLPPTPISNVGKETIYATARPLQTKDLYFVANGNGGHNFSRNLREHNRNVQKLRAYERRNKKQ